MRTAAKSRVLKEYSDLDHEEYKNYNLTLIDPTDIFNCYVTIIGPEGYGGVLNNY